MMNYIMKTTIKMYSENKDDLKIKTSSKLSTTPKYKKWRQPEKYRMTPEMKKTYNF